MIPDNLAPSNVNRSYTLAGVSITIFTFSLTFLFPRFSSGDIDPLLFQAALAMMGVTTFSFVIATLYYYGASLPHMGDAERTNFAKIGDRLWLMGYSLLFLNPSVILIAVGLVAVGVLWFVLWLVYVIFAARLFPRMSNPRNSA